MKHIACIILMVTVFASCEKPELIGTDVVVKPVRSYVFLGHTYETNGVVDPRVVALDYSKFDQIWLGGDICSETTEEEATLDMLDDLFDLSSPTTHWTLGNHDVRNGNVQWITNRTKRPTYYTATFDGITIMILNTMLNSSGFGVPNVKEQLEMIQNVCDTIQNSSHLILMTHHMVWQKVLPNSNPQANTNGSNHNFNLNPNQQYHECVYPLLLQVKARGVEVIHISGDYGQQVATFDGQSTEGIQYLGSGIASNTNWHSQFPTHGIPDSILVFHHNILERDISWEFVQLD